MKKCLGSQTQEKYNNAMHGRGMAKKYQSLQSMAV